MALPTDVAADADIKVTATSKLEYSDDWRVALEIPKADLVDDTYRPQVVGEVVAPADASVSAPMDILVVCVDDDGKPGTSGVGFTDGSSNLHAGETATFSASLFDDDCPTFMVAASGRKA